MLGLVTDAVTVNISSSSSTVSPSMVMGWHTEVPTAVAEGMTILSDSSRKSSVSKECIPYMGDKLSSLPKQSSASLLVLH